MKLQNSRQKSPLKSLFVVLGIVIVVGGGLVAYYFYQHTNSDKKTSIDYGPATSEQIKSGNAAKEKSTTTDKPGSGGSETPPAPTPQQNSQQSLVGVHLTSSNQNGNFYQVRFQIDTNTNAGSCKLTLTRDSHILTYSSGVQALSETATCKGFNVPIDASHLTKGSWQLNLTYSSDTLTGQATGSIQVQ